LGVRDAHPNAENKLYHLIGLVTGLMESTPSCVLRLSPDGKKFFGYD